jgi:hypothetical protein
VEHKDAWAQVSFNISAWQPASFFELNPLVEEYRRANVAMPRSYRPQYHGSKYPIDNRGCAVVLITCREFRYDGILTTGDAIRAMLGDRFVLLQSFLFGGKCIWEADILIFVVLRSCETIRVGQ